MAESSSSPAWLAILAGLTLVPILVLAGVSTARLLSDRVAIETNDRSSSDRPTVPTSAAVASSPVAAVLPDWTDKLSAASCDGPCVGGILCSMTGNRPCPSRFTCIPGASEDVLDALMPLSLRLSSLLDQNSQLDLCKANLTVCFTPKSSQNRTCIPLADACSHGARSTATVAVLAADLAAEGIGVSVLRGTALGAELATGNIRYGTPIRRVGLCSGFKAGGFVNRPGSHVKFVTFFVEPRRAE